MRRFTSIEAGPGAFMAKYWGYPRDIYEDEAIRAVWFAYGLDAVFWLEPVVGDRRTGIFHLAVDPRTQKRHGMAARELFKHLKVFSDLNGFDRLIANDCTESGEVTDYLQRLGWTPCVMETIEGEWYEKRFVDGDEDSHEQAPETEDRPTV